MKYHYVVASLSAGAITCLLQACGGVSDSAPTATSAPPFAATAECAALKNMNIADTTIVSAEQIPAGSYTPPGGKVPFDNLPEFCRLTAKVAPVTGSSIGIEVWLPTKAWNGRYQQVGTHGVGGVIYWSEMAPQLRRGFATGATDTGHLASEGLSSWAIGKPERLVDYAFRAVHELAEKSKTSIKAYYGRPQEYAYYNGCSMGGANGMKAAQLYPNDFNGIIAGGAAAYTSRANTSQLIQTLNLRAAGIQGARGAEILQMTQKAAIAACDTLDGVKDGIISNPTRCTWSPATLVCKPGQDPATCITPTQATALTANVSPVLDPDTGATYFPGLPRGSEHDQLRFSWNNALSFAGLAVYQIALQDAAWNGSTFDFRRDTPIAERMLAQVNAIDPDLSAFRKAGGKLIQWHTWDDSQFAPEYQTRYYDQVVGKMGGAEATGDFYRLFMMPAQGHCAGSGDGPSNIGAENQIAVSNDAEHDVVTALETWVTKGVAPNVLIASRYKDNDPKAGIDMQRPLCPYPLEAVYKGSGDTNIASNFSCGRP